MMPTYLALLAVLLAVVATALAAQAWRKLSPAHWRIHRLEQSKADLEKLATGLARSALEAEVRARVPGSLARSHAQHGEDYFLWQRLGFKREGVFVEIGAYNGVSLSNSKFFEDIGWRGLLVEAHPALAEECRIQRPGSVTVQAALGEVNEGTATFTMVRGEPGVDTLSFAATSDQHRRRVAGKGAIMEKVSVPARTLASVLEEHGIEDIDWISIDVEGGELGVLKGADFSKVSPRMLLIEDNSGGRDRAVAEFLAQFGYRREQSIGCNDLYTRAVTPSA